MKTPLEVASGIKPTGNTNDDVLLFISAFIKKNQFAPFLEEICDGLDIIQGKTVTNTSKSHVAGILKSLEDDGDISIIRDPWGRHEPGRILLNERVLKKPIQRDTSK
jgi:hypothetical protein